MAVRTTATRPDDVGTPDDPGSSGRGDGHRPADEHHAGEAPAMTHRQVLEALSGIFMGMFVVFLSANVVATSLPIIVSDLGGSQSTYTWVVTATLLSMTASTPIWGKLADLFPRKALMMTALGVFVAGSAMAGLSQDMSQLIAFRVVQGLGVGGLMALGQVVIADIVSPRERGRYMGYMGAVMAVGTIGGPLLGGLLTDSVGWRWNFYVCVPVALVALVVLQRTLKLPRPPKRKVIIDYLGAVLITGGVSALMIWVSLAGHQFDWVSPQSGALVAGSVVALLLAYVVERHAAEPIVPLHLFQNRTLVLAVVASISVGIAMFGTSVFLSQYMQIARAKSPTESGLLTLPMVLGTLVASTIIGQVISRTGVWKRWVVTGGVLLTVGSALMATIDYHTSFVWLSIFMAVLGLGVGMIMQNLVLVTQNSVPVGDLGAASSVVAFFRSMGGAIGVSVLGAVLASRVGSMVASGLADAGLPTAGTGSGSAVPQVSELPEGVRTIVEQAYGTGVADLFLIATPIALVATIAAIFLPNAPLGTKTAVQQQAELAVVEAAPETSGFATTRS